MYTTSVWTCMNLYEYTCKIRVLHMVTCFRCPHFDSAEVWRLFLPRTKRFGKPSLSALSPARRRPAIDLRWKVTLRPSCPILFGVSDSCSILDIHKAKQLEIHSFQFFQHIQKYPMFFLRIERNMRKQMTAMPRHARSGQSLAGPMGRWATGP